MFLGHTNTKVCVLVNAIVLDLCKSLEQKKSRKSKKKVEILLYLKNCKKNFIILYGFYNDLLQFKTCYSCK